MDTSFAGLLIVMAVAFAAPVVLGLAPRLRLPAVVLEIVAGIVIGPSVLGWVEVDRTIDVLALVGLAFLLFLAGLEVDLAHLRGARLRLAATGFAASFAIAVAVGYGLQAAGAAEDGLFTAIVLAATSLGIVIPLLKDAGLAQGEFGQLVIAAASLADFATVILLSLFFSGQGGGIGATLVIIGGMLALAAVLVVALRRVGMWSGISAVLERLQDTTAQIRVRGAFLILIGWVALAGQLGLEVILGAFTAGAVLNLLDRDGAMTHPAFRAKLEGAGFGFFIPVFFVASGLRFDLDALLSSPSTVARAPLFLLALLVVRGVPALLYRRAVGTRLAIAAGLLQATSLPFIVASVMIGLDLGVIGAATGSAMIAAGLLSVLVFPIVASTLLRAGREEAPAGAVVAA